MSFGGSDGDGAVNEFQKKFVSEDQLDEKRKKRQEEWEKVRKPEDPKEAPEEAYDHRSLFDRLEEQKQKKQDEYDEQFALKNQVKGLEEEEVDFLDFVSKRQEELDKERQKADSDVLNEYRSAIAAETLEKPSASQKSDGKSKLARPAAQGKKSQQALLMGAVKRKSTADTDKDESDKSPDKKAKMDDSAEKVPSTNSNNGLAKVIGILPGLGAYDNSSDERDSSDDSTSDDAEGLGLMAPKKVIVIQQ